MLNILSVSVQVSTSLSLVISKIFGKIITEFHNVNIKLIW